MLLRSQYTGGFGASRVIDFGGIGTGLFEPHTITRSGLNVTVIFLTVCTGVEFCCRVRVE